MTNRDIHSCSARIVNAYPPVKLDLSKIGIELRSVTIAIWKLIGLEEIDVEFFEALFNKMLSKFYQSNKQWCI